MLEKRLSRLETIRKITAALNYRYHFEYDVCESATTEIYLILNNGSKVLVKVVANDVFDSDSINVYDFSAPTGMICYYKNMNLL